MANEENGDQSSSDRRTQNGGRRGQRNPRINIQRIDVVSVRRSGTRYPTQRELSEVQEKAIYGASGRKLFFRFLLSFILVVLVGTALLLFGISFVAQAKRYQDQKKSSIPLVFCVLAIVLGILMHLGAIVLAHYMITNKLWLRLRSRESPRRRTSSSSNQGLRPNESSSSLSPPDPAEAPPLYSVSQQHALAPPIMQYLAANQSLATPDGTPLSPNVLFVLPSYDDVVKQKESPECDVSPPAYCEHSEQTEENSRESSGIDAV